MFVTCLVEDGTEVVEFDVEKCLPYAVGDGFEPFRSWSAYSFRENGDSSAVIVNAG